MAETADVSLQQRLGRAMTDLGLEDRVVNDGYLPTIKIAERAALVEGVIDGLLATGRVRELFERVYLQTPMRGLFDGYGSLPQRVIDAVGKLKPGSVVLGVDENAYHDVQECVKRLYKQVAGTWRPEDVLRFAMLSQVKDPYTVVNPVWERLSEAQQASWHVHRGGLALEKGAHEKAYKHFLDAKDEARLDALFEKVMKDPSKAGAGVLLDFARRNSYDPKREKHIEGLREKIDTQRDRIYEGLVKDPTAETLPVLLELTWYDEKRMDAVLEGVMKKPELLGQKIGVNGCGRYELGHRGSPSVTLAEYFLKMGAKKTNERWFLKSGLTKQQRNALLDVVGAHTKSYEIEKSDDPALRLRWAQLHWGEEPHAAYKIFREQKYAGNEVGAAVGKIVHKGALDYRERDRIEAFIREMDPEHLKALYDDAPRWVQPAIAWHLRDTARLREWSHVFFKSGQENDLSRAYRFWMAAGGGEEPFADELRKALIDEQAKKQYWWTPHELSDDRKGLEMWCDRVLDRHPDRAYAAAIELKDETRRDAARQKILVENGGAAYGFFREKKDEIGFELAVGMLAKKYDVPAETLMPLLRKE